MWRRRYLGKVEDVLGKIEDIKSDTTFVDLGCGEGAQVNRLREEGYEAYGCDFFGGETRPLSAEIEEGLKRDILKTIESPYRLPFKDSSVDYIFSNAVFEHVMDYDTTFREIHRILKPGGLSINSFPARYIFIEPHAYVPLASVIRNRPWLYFWALVGVRNEYQKGDSAKTVTEKNYKYLRTRTNYLTRKQILSHARSFSETSFREDLMLNWRIKGRVIRKLSTFKPFANLPTLMGDFSRRLLVLRK